MIVRKLNVKRSIFLFSLSTFFALMLSTFVHAEGDASEIRVNTIRPRYFRKTDRFELGVQTAMVMNQTFYYTALIAGSFGFHFNEVFGVEFLGAYGLSWKKEDAGILKKDFGIETQFAPLERYYGGNILWTPIYGKYQLSSGRLVYFDSFLSGGGGVLGLREKFEHCSAGSSKRSQVIQSPYFSFGVGQRFFISKDDSIRWDLRAPMFYSNTSDSSCFDGSAGEKQFFYNLNFQVGYSRFI